MILVIAVQKSPAVHGRVPEFVLECLRRAVKHIPSSNLVPKIYRAFFEMDEENAEHRSIIYCFFMYSIRSRYFSKEIIMIWFLFS